MDIADNTLRVAYTIHLTHICMHMHFHTFYRRRIGDLLFLCLTDFFSLTDKIFRKIIKTDRSEDLDTISHLNTLNLVPAEIPSFKDLHDDCVFPVKYGYRLDQPVGILYLKPFRRKHITGKLDLSDRVINILQGNNRIVIMFDFVILLFRRFFFVYRFLRQEIQSDHFFRLLLMNTLVTACLEVVKTDGAQIFLQFFQVDRREFRFFVLIKRESQCMCFLVIVHRTAEQRRNLRMSGFEEFQIIVKIIL